jgi:hypothetical protein
VVLLLAQLGKLDGVAIEVLDILAQPSQTRTPRSCASTRTDSFPWSSWRMAATWRRAMHEPFFSGSRHGIADIALFA